MGFRFHKSRAILPGVRLNLSKSGPSLSFGPQGARVNVGSRGVRTTLGVPGTGISHITQKSWSRLSGRWPARPARAARDFDVPSLSKDESRAAFLRLLAASSLDDVKRQKKAFDTYVKDHPGELEENQIAAIRQLYADEIARKAVVPQSEPLSRWTEHADPQSIGGRFQRALLSGAKLISRLFGSNTNRR